MSAEEFARTYGAADEDLRATLDFLASKDLRVTEADAGRRRVLVEGTASEINSAFGITLNLYRAPHHFVPRPPLRRGRGEAETRTVAEHEYRGFEGPIHLPTALIKVVAAVVGLDNRKPGGPAGTGTGDPPGASSLLPTTIAQLYRFPNTGAAGQTIGLFAAADEGAAYLPSDVALFIASLPPGYNLPPNVTPIGLTVGGTTYSNNTGPITGGFASGAAQETTQDVQTSAAIGQGANINVYFTENSEAGWEAFFARAVFPPAGDIPPTVLSASWVLYLDDSWASGGFVTAVSFYLQAAAIRGITALIAIGDWGAANQIHDTLCHVSHPNSDPWFTACGGTIIGNVSASTPPTFEEWAWSDANTGTQFDLGVYDATGGGVSAIFPVPPYQVAAGVLPISKNDGNSRRGLPDVAGMVGLTGFFIDGGGYSFTGTSCVAPLYAGLIATINKFLGHSVGFLNPTLYTYGPEICNDITVGNNDSGYVPDSPFYTTAIGWDPCTGWGSIHGYRLLAALAPAAIIETAIATAGNFGGVCVDSFIDDVLTINNSGFAELLISNIVITPAGDFSAPKVTSYPLAVSPGASIDIVIRFKPVSSGPKTATVTILSNSIFGPHKITVTGTGETPRLALVIADRGNFADVCVGHFADESLIVSNSGKCLLSVKGLSSSSGEFQLPHVLSFPINIAAGNFLPFPIRFAPTSFGAKAATITVTSNDPASPAHIAVSGTAPPGKLAVTGSLCFGGVKACCCEERTISICNVGDCSLHVTSVAFKRKSRHWKLVNNPFPATLHAGSCLSVVIRYIATEKCPRACELIITSDDPTTPTKTLDVMAYTIWGGCGCKQSCDDCRKGCCDKHHKECCCEDCGDGCCDDGEEEGT